MNQRRCNEDRAIAGSRLMGLYEQIHRDFWGQPEGAVAMMGDIMHFARMMGWDVESLTVEATMAFSRQVEQELEGA